jgi:DNA-binding winged helix-turn-helix (wHTH) protein
MSTAQWCFDNFRLDLAHACLWRDAESVTLSPKVFDLLHYFVTHPDRLVTKDELLDTVWSQTAVSEAVLRVAISALRKVLGDLAQTPQFIATVPRRGYRFLAPVIMVDLHETDRIGPPLQPAELTPPHQETAAMIPNVLTSQDKADACPYIVCPPLQSRAVLDGERKQVTVLYAIVTNALELSRGLDSEAAQRLLDPVLHHMLEAVQRYAGTVNQVMGDGIMALFGVPMTYEDHAARACYAALAMQSALRAYADDVHRVHGLVMQICIGLHTGEIVVRSRRHDLSMGYTGMALT